MAAMAGPRQVAGRKNLSTKLCRSRFLRSFGPDSKYWPGGESTFRRPNGSTDDQVAADREDLCRNRSGEEGRKGRHGNAGERWLQGTQEERGIPGSGLCQVRRDQEARHQGARGYQSLQRGADGVQGQTGPEDRPGPPGKSGKRRRVSVKRPLRGLLHVWGSVRGKRSARGRPLNPTCAESHPDNRQI